MLDRMKLKQYVFLLSFLLLSSPFLKAQDFALKSNLLYDATATINIGAEVGLSSRWTLDVSGNFNGWTMSHERRWKHWMLQPEARYWFCQRFGGHFLGMEAHGGQFNVGGLNNSIHFLGTHVSRLSDERFQGWFVGGGVTYGYAWMLGRHWNLEAEIGVGYSYTRYDTYRCAGCGKKTEEGKRHNYYGPTKAALSLVYIF
ncbi:hypothetical protein IMSAGC004_02567 [Bacteroidaceae bacterium]|nr:hypothetical protein IMSAGC004_02567 [Bacteroidaceae bacterium]